MSGTCSAPDPLRGTFAHGAATHALNLPFNGLSITDTTFPNGTAGGAIDDGLDGWLIATWTTNSPNIKIKTYTGIVSVATNVEGNAVVTLSDAPPVSGAEPQPDWVGKPIAISYGGGIFQAIVTNHYFDPNNSHLSAIVLSAPPPTELVGVTLQTLACPCFTPYYVGKNIWIANGARAPATTQDSFASPLASVPYSSVIASIIDPFNAILAVNISAPTFSNPTLIRWGTNNTVAVQNCAAETIKAGRKGYWAPGWRSLNSTGLFLMFDAARNNNTWDASSRATGVALAAVRPWTCDARLIAMSDTFNHGNASSGFFQDFELRKQGIDWDGVDAHPQPERGVWGATSLPRCSSTMVITAAIVGDSWGGESPSGTGGNSCIHHLKRAFERANKSKTIQWVNRAIGGYTARQLASTSAISGSNPGTPWASDGRHSLTYWLQNTEYGVPDVIFVVLTGANDGTYIFHQDLMTFLNACRTFPTRNGLPPDVVFINGAVKNGDMWSAATSETFDLQTEYSAVLIRGLCRSNGIPLIELDPTFDLANNGWSPKYLKLRNIPPFKQQTVTPTVPLILPETRDFCIVLQLGSAQTGSAFWAAAKTLEMTLSPKMDARVIISCDAGNNLQGQVNAWGAYIATTMTIGNGATALSTSGQTVFHPNHSIKPQAPSFILQNENSSFSTSFVNACLYFVGCGYQGQAFRSIGQGYTNVGVMFCADSNDQATVCTSAFAGGWMFHPWDVYAGNCKGADVMFTSGAISYRGTISGVTDYQTAMLSTPWTGTGISESTISLFIGKISYGPGQMTQTPAGTDVGADALLIIEKIDTRLRVAYVLGSNNEGRAADFNVRNFSVPVLECDIEVPGGPFCPHIFSSGIATLTPVGVWIGEKILYRPSMASRTIMGSPGPTWPSGGDTSHMTMEATQRLVSECMNAQDFSTSVSYQNTFGANTPTTGFCYTVPRNQAFTELTPAGTLATGMVTLPAVFPQGGRVEIFSSQTVTALTVTAAAEFGIQGTVVTTITGGATIAYRLIGTTWTRVQ